MSYKKTYRTSQISCGRNQFIDALEISHDFYGTNSNIKTYPISQNTGITTYNVIYNNVIYNQFDIGGLSIKIKLYIVYDNDPSTPILLDLYNIDTETEKINYAPNYDNYVIPRILNYITVGNGIMYLTSQLSGVPINCIGGEVQCLISIKS